MVEIPVAPTVEERRDETVSGDFPTPEETDVAAAAADSDGGGQQPPA